MGEAVKCVAMILFVAGIINLSLMAMDSTEIKCRHEHRVIEWHGSLHEVVIHTPECPEIN